MIGFGETWSRRSTCRARAYLTRTHERHDHCYVLLEGVLVREKRLERGGRQIVGLYVPGDICGLSALSGDSAEHDTVALSPVSYVAVASHWLSSAARESTDLLKAIWREMSREAAISAAWTVNIGQRSAYQRLAHFMCELDARLRASGQDTSTGFEWPGTQADIQAATGLSLVHVNKTLRRLEADRLVSCGRRVTVHDAAQLGTIAGFDPGYLSLDRESLGNMLLSRIDGFEGARKTRGLDPLGASPENPVAALPRMTG